MIVLEEVFFQYPNSQKKILNNITLTFDKNKVNVVIGLNGAGKTTLFDMITGVIKQQQGRILNVPKLEDIVYQTQGLYFSPVLKGKDIARLILKISNENFINDPIMCLNFKDQRQQDLITSLWNKKFGQMSIGERRWLIVTLIGRINRQLYIFDEPTSGVDPSSRLLICNALEKICLNEERIVVMSTHQLQELEFLNCKIFVLHEGSVKFCGSYNDFLELYGSQNPDKAFQACIEASYSA